MIPYRRILALVLFLACCTLAAPAQHAGKTERATLAISSDPRKTEDVQTINRGGVRYVQMDDIARFLSARTFINAVLKKIELILPAVRIKYGDQSPFVVITHLSDGSQTVTQLASPAVFTGGAFIIPADDFFRLYESLTQQKISFAGEEPAAIKTPADKQPAAAAAVTQPAAPPAAEQLSVGTAEKTGGYSVTGIDVEEKKNGYLLRIHASERLPDAEKMLQGGEWLYITVPRGRANISQLGGSFPTGLVKRLIPVQSSQSLQLSFQLREKIESAELVPDRSGTDILVALRTVNLPGTGAIAPPQRTEPAEKKQPSGADPANGKNKSSDAETTIEKNKQSDAEPAIGKNPPAGAETMITKKQPTAAEMKIGKERPDTIVEVQKQDAAVAETVVEPKEPSDAERNVEKQKKKWKLDVVVLDAGHGGHDPGTIGSMGTNEKNVTLGIALKLGALIEKNMPGVKVVYTRKSDRFVELYRRGQIANEAGGKLFISIHCNSTPKKATAINGFEIYLLRPGKTETAIEIAEQENSVVRLEKDFEYRYEKLTEENYIILTMAQSAYVKQSERFAEILESEMAKKMVYQSRGVKQAGFYVLVGASMPNLLIEAGYLSNKRDETLLRGLPGQYLAAESIFDGLKKFKLEYERNFMDD